MNAHGLSQNETARLEGISTDHLSLITNDLRRLHEVLFRPTAAELVAPMELKVMGWKTDDRKGVVVGGTGGPHNGRNPGGGAAHIGGRVPWVAEVEYAYTTSYDSRGQVSVNHLVDERGHGVMRKEPGAEGA